MEPTTFASFSSPNTFLFLYLCTVPRLSGLVSWQITVSITDSPTEFHFQCERVARFTQSLAAHSPSLVLCFHPRTLSILHFLRTVCQMEHITRHLVDLLNCGHAHVRWVYCVVTSLLLITSSWVWSALSREHKRCVSTGVKSQRGCCCCFYHFGCWLSCALIPAECVFCNVNCKGLEAWAWVA